MNPTGAELLRPQPLPVETILFDGPLVRVGSFHCPADDPLFADSGPIVNPVFVFPRTGVWIEHEGDEAFVADPTLATLYNRNQIYRRRRLSEAGDYGDWFALAPMVLAEVASAWDPPVQERPDRPFPWSRTPVDNRIYLAQRRLVDRLHRDMVEPLEVEEEAIRLARMLLASGHRRGRTEQRRGSRPGGSRRPRDHAERARELLAERFREPLSLGEIAQEVGVSPFHLCRVFKHASGQTLHAYRTQLRLRDALGRLRDGGAELTEIALDSGFSSHSHFTASFRRAFGVTPSAFAEG